MNDPDHIFARSGGARPLRERLISGCCQLLSACMAGMQHLPPLPVGPCRILVLKPGVLGDVLMTTPVLAALRTRFPQAKIDYAVGQYALPAIAGHPEVSALVDTGPASGRGRGALLGLLRRMRAGQYDICLVLDRSPVLATLPLLAGIPIRAGIDSSGRGFALNVRVPWNESLHEADLYLSVAGALGCPTNGYHLSFVPGDAAEQQVDALWAARGLRAPVVVLAPGGGTNPGMDLPEKRWLPTHFAALGDRLRAEFQATIVLLGGPGDQALCATVRQAMRGPAIDLSGPAPFAERGALLRRCALFVGNDSGPTHLAVAVGCPVVAIFGPTDPGLYGPYHAPARTVRRPLSCSPCFVHGYFPPCPNQHACMRGLEVATVFEACRDLLRRPGAPAMAEA
jgi:lipopolysaccharide heptosyltransferase II